MITYKEYAKLKIESVEQYKCLSALYGKESAWNSKAVGNLMNKAKASYTKGLANWQMGIAILEWNGKNMTPTLIPINKDGSFTALGKSYGA